MKEFVKQGGDESKQERRRPVEELTAGFDELNLAEFPLASVSDRFLDGKKDPLLVNKAPRR